MLNTFDPVNALGWKGRDEFVENTQKKKVLIHRNGDFDEGKVIYIEAEWTLTELFIVASKRLDIVPTAKRVFNSNGVEIDDCMMIEDDDLLFLSSGSNYIIPTLNEDNNTTTESNSSENQSIKPPPLVGSYKVGDVLGRGGFGEVRVGIHQLTGERVALKFMKKSEIASIGAAERTATEIQILTALQHPNIIRLHQHVELPQFVVLIFELMEGGDLLQYLCQRGETSDDISLTEDEARLVFLQVINGVGYAHNQHICHRDLKLENLLLKDQSINHVKIADFGLSGFYRPGSTMRSNCGTLSFLAPEVFRGTSNAGPPLDIWSLGVVLYALLCGRLPFEGTDLRSDKRPRDNVIISRIMKCQYKLDDKLSLEVKDLIRRMMKPDPAERASIPDILNHIWMKHVNPNRTIHLENTMNSNNNSSSGTNNGTHGGGGGGLFGSLNNAPPSASPDESGQIEGSNQLKRISVITTLEEDNIELDVPNSTATTPIPKNLYKSISGRDLTVTDKERDSHMSRKTISPRGDEVNNNKLDKIHEVNAQAIQVLNESNSRLSLNGRSRKELPSSGASSSNLSKDKLHVGLDQLSLAPPDTSRSETSRSSRNALSPSQIEDDYPQEYIGRSKSAIMSVTSPHTPGPGANSNPTDSNTTEPTDNTSNPYTTTIKLQPLRRKSVSRQNSISAGFVDLPAVELALTSVAENTPYQSTIGDHKKSTKSVTSDGRLPSSSSAVRKSRDRSHSIANGVNTTDSVSSKTPVNDRDKKKRFSVTDIDSHDRSGYHPDFTNSVDANDILDKLSASSPERSQANKAAHERLSKSGTNTPVRRRPSEVKTTSTTPNNYPNSSSGTPSTGSILAHAGALSLSSPSNNIRLSTANGPRNSILHTNASNTSIQTPSNTLSTPNGSSVSTRPFFNHDTDVNDSNTTNKVRFH